MRVTVICTGTELLKGTTVNTNLTFIGQKLSEAGIVPERALVVGDAPADMQLALETAAPVSDLIITTGGLGPTNDDLTRKVVCDFLQIKLTRDAAIEKDLADRWRRRYSTEPPKNYLSQADVPRNATVLHNAVGTAPGLWLQGKHNGNEVEVILLPGPPRELDPMLCNEAMPLLRKKVAQANYTESFMVVGGAELLVQKKVEPLVKDLPLSLAYCASVEGVKVFFSGHDQDLVKSKAEEAKKLFGDLVLADNELSLVKEVSGRLKKHSLTLGTAESCTGGMIAEAVTSLPGSSQIFSGSIVSYSNAVKAKQLDVPEEILETYGAVSSQCVEAMVKGAAKALEVDAAVAVSGIAGPDGGTPEKPVGLVFIGAKLHEQVIVRKYVFPGQP